MFPGPHAHVYRNEAGEPVGWDYPSDDAYDVSDYYENDRDYDDDEGDDDA